MNNLKVGYAEVNINPALGIGVYGYYVPRFAKGFLDDLKAMALSLACGDKKVVLVALDLGAIHSELVEEVTVRIEEETGVPRKNILLSASHTHTSPLIRPMDSFEADVNVSVPVFTLAIKRFDRFVMIFSTFIF